MNGSTKARRVTWLPSRRRKEFWLRMLLAEWHWSEAEQLATQEGEAA